MTFFALACDLAFKWWLEVPLLLIFGFLSGVLFGFVQIWTIGSNVPLLATVVADNLLLGFLLAGVVSLGSLS